MKKKTLHVFAGTASSSAVKHAIPESEMQSCDFLSLPVSFSSSPLPKDFSDDEILKSVIKHGSYERYKEFKRFVNYNFNKYERIIVWHGDIAHDQLFMLFMCKLVPCDKLYEIDLTRIDELKGYFESRIKDREKHYGKRPYYSCSMILLPVSLIKEHDIISRAEKVSEERYAYCRAQYDHWQKSKAAFIYENESGELQGYPKAFMDKEIFKALKKHKVSAKIIYEVVGNLIQYGISPDDVYFRLMELCESGYRIILEFEKR